MEPTAQMKLTFVTDKSMVENQMEKLVVTELDAQIVLTLTMEKSIVEHGEVSPDKFGGTNASDVHNREVCDDEIEKFDSKKEMEDEVNEKQNATI